MWQSEIWSYGHCMMAQATLMHSNVRYKTTHKIQLHIRKVYQRYLGFGIVFSIFFFPRVFGGAGTNSSQDGTGKPADDSTFSESGLLFPLHFFCFVDTSAKSPGLAICKQHLACFKLLKKYILTFQA